MKKEFISKIDRWQSIFILKVDTIKDKDRKILILKKRVCELEKQNRVLKNRLTGSKEIPKTDQPVNLLLGKNFYKSRKWLSLRYHFLNKNKKECVCCGSSANLQVDHKIPRVLRPDLAFEESNLQILCRDCNFGKLDSV
jgi:5-methylcytosine-specific restriction endonuclease McrA